MADGSLDVELSMDELRVVARYAAEAAQRVLHLYEDTHPGDPRPRDAIEAAWTFANGASRTQLQRVTAVEAHRAAKDAASDGARYAAQAAGDAAAAAYLHPLARATQVRHILGAAAHAARAAEAVAGDPSVGDEHIEQFRLRVTPDLVDVLRRYPPAPTGVNRVARLLKALDTALRSS